MTAVLLAGLAAWLAWPVPRAARLAGLTRGRAPARPAGRTPVLLAAWAAATLLVGPGLAVVLTLAGWCTSVGYRRQAAGRERDRVSAAAPGCCRALAAELRAGADPGAALRAAAELAPPALAAHLMRAGSAAALGLDVADLLAHPPPAAAGLAPLGACWRVGAGAGAGLAAAVERFAQGLAADERCRREIAAQLAGPRASALLLAGLPAAGLLLAVVVGAAPTRFLGSSLGLACLTAGLALDAAGLAWTRALARSAQS